MEKIKSILDRRSVRSFTGEAVSREDVETILRAGMAAPSMSVGGLSQQTRRPTLW